MNRLTFSTVILAVLFSGCGDRSSAELASLPSSNTSAAPPVETRNADYASTANTALNSNAAVKQERRSMSRPSVPGQTTALADAVRTGEAPLTIDRKVIRNAEIQLEADSPEDVQRSISGIAERRGGFVVESQQSIADPRSSRRDTITMSVRVPAEKFADTLEEVRLSAKRVVSETIKGDDVTEEFIDVEARLKAKKALEQQFTAIMKRAHSVDDALNVQSELAEVRSEIEKIEGRKRFLESQTSMSTIRIKLQTPAAISKNSDGFADKLSESFGTGLDFAINFVLGVVTIAIGLLPFALLVGVPGFFVARSIIRRRNRPMTFSEIAKDEIRTE